MRDTNFEMNGTSLRRRLASAVWLFALLASACGGRTEGGLEDGVPYDPVPSKDSSSQGGGKGGLKGTVLHDPTALGPCEPGVEPALAATCDYVFKDLCYPSKLAACACACPRDSKNSTCVSSFDLPSRVSCF